MGREGAAASASTICATLVQHLLISMRFPAIPYVENPPVPRERPIRTVTCLDTGCPIRRGGQIRSPVLGRPDEAVNFVLVSVLISVRLSASWLGLRIILAVPSIRPETGEPTTMGPPHATHREAGRYRFVRDPQQTAKPVTNPDDPSNYHRVRTAAGIAASSPRRPEPRCRSRRKPGRAATMKQPSLRPHCQRAISELPHGE